MGDNGDLNKEKEELSKEESKDLILTITLKVGGGLEVAGPGNGQMYDEPMCFWMLDKAQDFIKFRNAKAIQPNIVLPRGLMRRR